MLDGLEDGERLGGQWDTVGAAHLSLLLRDGPKRLVEIEVGPFSIAQFARTHEHMREQAQRCFGVGKTLERLDGAQ